RPLPERVRVAVRKGMAPPVGSFVAFHARLTPPVEPLRPGGYDFARDLYFQKIGASGFVMGHITPQAPPSPPRLPECATPSTSASAPRWPAMRALLPRR